MDTTDATHGGTHDATHDAKHDATHGATHDATRGATHEGPIARWWPWILRVVWVALPFTVGQALADGLAARSQGVRLAALGIAWAWWGVGLLATLVPHPIGLVVLRVASPTALAAAAWSFGDASDAHAIVATAAGALAVVVALAADTGHVCVNGPAYPNERRYLLRPPAVLLLGPIPLAGVAMAAGTVVGPLLLGAERWVAGAVVSVVGFAVTFLAGRALYAVGRRFLVFVPAGLVLHDPESLRDPVLFRRQVVEAIGPALADSDSLDLTANAPGLAIEVQLREKVEITRVRNSRDVGETGKTARFLVVPSMPGRFLRAAAARRFPTPR